MRALWIFIFACSLSFSVEVISSISQTERGWQIESESGRKLFLKSGRDVRFALSQLSEGDSLEVKGSGVVALSHAGMEATLFAEEREERLSNEEIDAIEIFAIPRSGSRYLKSLVQQNFPALRVTMNSFQTRGLSEEMLLDMVDGVGSMHALSEKLRSPAKWKKSLSQKKLVLICVREPFDWLSSLYRLAAVPLKNDVERGFSLFLSGKGHLPRQICTKNPFTGERLDHPMRLRQNWMLQISYIKQIAPNAFVVDYNRLRTEPALVLAEISERFHLQTCPLFKEARLDTSGKGNYRPIAQLPMTAEQKMRIRALLDQDIEKIYGY